MASDSSKGLTGSGEYKTSKGTSFDDATTVKKRDESTYEALVPPDWCFGPVAHGGYLSSLLSRAAEQHLHQMSALSGRQLPETLSSCSVTYVAPVLPGRAEIRIENRNVGRGSAHLAVSLYQGAPESSAKNPDAGQPLVLRAEAIVLFTTAASMTKSSLSRPMHARRRLPMSEMYPREKEGHHVPHHDSGMAFFKHKPEIECYFRADSADREKMLNSHPEHGPAVFDVWWKLDHDATIHELGFVADLTGPVLFNYEDVRKTHWLSTRQMSVDVVRLPQKSSGWEWLFCRMELIENAGDRFYCDVTIADESGEVVGIARQSCVVRPFELVGKRKSKKETEQKSKM